MKRDYFEISDDEWDNHSFKPSRVLKKTQTSAPPPPIESFAYRAGKHENSDQSSADCVQLDENLEDEDVEFEGGKPGAVANRGRRFVVDDEESDRDVAEVYEIESTDEDEVEEEEADENDVVGRALYKCSKISAELKKELYGSSGTACDRYSEAESSSVRIVNQDDIDVACGSEDSDFQPILKPYQLVGVNFLLLLYRKGIGGGTYVSLSDYWESTSSSMSLVSSSLASFEVELFGADWYSALSHCGIFKVDIRIKAFNVPRSVVPHIFISYTTVVTGIVQYGY